MSRLDWIVLLGTLGFIVVYGMWKTRSGNTRENYLRSGGDERWWGVGLSVMATQASAITFLSTPGQGFVDGMGFVQFYFGLPLAMLVIGAVFLPLYYKWKVYTAYEFIGRRFDRRTRLLTAALFLIQRSLAAGITIYAPSILLSRVLHWPLSWTCVFIGVLVIAYTTSGGARAVGVTHKQQMAVMILGIFVAFGLTVYALHDTLSLRESLGLAHALGKLDVIDPSWDPANRYTLWSGLIGGFFLQLSYFGTDQSQVQRYLGARSIQQARQGLWMNGMLKIPMQFFILLTGVLVFVFYVFHPAPVHWNEANVALARAADTTGRTQELEQAHAVLDGKRAQAARAWLAARRDSDPAAAAASLATLEDAQRRDQELRADFDAHLARLAPNAETNDKDSIFISYVMQNMPIGIIGLLLAMIFCAGMSSTSAELSALATTCTVDVLPAARDERASVRTTQIGTVLFGLLALGFAALFSLFDNLIQAVNILGSLFYGTILGIFLVAFFLRHVGARAVFVAALVAQAVILALFVADVQIAFLWYNLIAPAILVVLALLLQLILRGKSLASLSSEPPPSAPPSV
ncbi:MAG: sodium:solute symporter [Planctomycetes bacterium]|nr:sodium:solute symporter [Planctomycetota bacterium]